MGKKGVVPMGNFTSRTIGAQVLHQGGPFVFIFLDDVLVKGPVYLCSNLLVPLKALLQILLVPWSCDFISNFPFVVTGDGLMMDD